MSINNDVVFDTCGCRIGYLAWNKTIHSNKTTILKGVKHFRHMFLFNTGSFPFEKYMRVDDNMMHCMSSYNISFNDSWLDDSLKSMFYRDVKCAWRCYQLSTATSSDYYKPHLKGALIQLKHNKRFSYFMDNKDEIEDETVKYIVEKMQLEMQ